MLFLLIPKLSNEVANELYVRIMSGVMKWKLKKALIVFYVILWMLRQQYVVSLKDNILLLLFAIVGSGSLLRESNRLSWVQIYVMTSVLSRVLRYTRP